MRVFTLLFIAFVGTISAKKGWDGIQSVSKAGFECLKKAGFDFFIGRVWTEVGNYDEHGIANVKAARAAGWTDVSAYIYPCTSSHCASPGAQVEATIHKLQSEGAKIDYLWLDIEGNGWNANKDKNRVFIKAMSDMAQKMGVKHGIYTGQYSWPQIVGDWTELNHLPLWWPNYNNDPGFDRFQRYGGWSKPVMHQYHGTVTEACGVSMDLNYKP